LGQLGQGADRLPEDERVFEAVDVAIFDQLLVEARDECEEGYGVYVKIWATNVLAN
jgi:hypothetical protein